MIQYQFTSYWYHFYFHQIYTYFTADNKIKLVRNVPLVILYQDWTRYHDSTKNMATRGRGLFSLYIYTENFKNLLVRNLWTDINIIQQNCFFDDPLPRLFKPSWSIKNMAPWDGAYIPCIYRNFEGEIEKKWGTACHFWHCYSNL